MKRSLFLLFSILVPSILLAQYDEEGDYKIKGDVGIGTPTPSTKLDVNGKIKLSNSLTEKRRLVGSGDNRIGMYNYNDAYNSRAWIELWGGEDSNRLGELSLSGNYIDFRYGSSLTSSGIIGMRLTDSGNLGIGTTNPGSDKLAVNGRIKLSNSLMEERRLVGSGDNRIGMYNYNDAYNSRAWIELWGGEDSNRLGELSLSGNYIDFRYGSSLTSSGIIGMRLTDSGNLGIGTSNPGSNKLAVNGSIRAKEIKVEASGWSDFVFANDYQLKSLEETEQFINENKHLPEIPSEAEVEEKGINLGEMDAKLLQKIEELTLYLIEQNKEIKNLKKEIQALKAQGN